MANQKRGHVPKLTSVFKQTVLFTGVDGRARFKQNDIALNEGNPSVALSKVFQSGGYQLRQSPVGFRSQWHCTAKAQWVFILQGRMGIGLRGGGGGENKLHEFTAGEHFYAADTLPEGATFDDAVHGHWSCQIGEKPLITLFIQENNPP